MICEVFEFVLLLSNYLICGLLFLGSSLWNGMGTGVVVGTASGHDLILVTLLSILTLS